MDVRPSLTEQYDVAGEAFAAIQQRLYDCALRLRDEEKGVLPHVNRSGSG